MNLKSGIKYGTIMAGIALGLSISSAHAGIAGSMILDMTGGCFSYGASGATGCNISGGSTGTAVAKEYATGSFTFNNTLSGISNPAAYAYQASVSLHAEDPDNAAVSFEDTRSKTFSTLADLTSHPLWGTARDFVLSVFSNPSGSFTATIPAMPPMPAMGSFTVFWNYMLNPESTPTDAIGSFEAWSTDDLNGLSLALLDRQLPNNPVNFTMNIRLDAISVPEPTMIALIGLGILGMGAAQRRKTSTPSA